MKKQNSLAGRFVRCEEGTDLRVTGVVTDGDHDGSTPRGRDLQSTLLEGGRALTIGVGDVSKRLHAPECLVSGCRCGPITASFARVRRSEARRLTFLAHQGVHDTTLKSKWGP